ncbi:hypothetical protein PUN28_005051 [Cardiocondyla obscurior]|uniref:Odorant receptor n=1 Tax=Cardiocondyla obscurior TaxID=286306 RepID=A0AAW2GFR0_9HYME
MFFFDPTKIEQIMEEIINNHQMLTDPKEIKIVEHYIYQGKIITILLTLGLVILSFLILILVLTPDILDFFRPLNKSRTHYILMLENYNITEGIQFYYFYTYAFASTFIGVFSIMAVSMMLILCSLYNCAMFKICSYRIEHSIDKKILACSNVRIVIVGRIIKMVKLHQRALKLFKLLITNFTVPFLALLVLGLFSFVSVMYRFLIAVTITHKMYDIIFSLIFIMAHYLYLFGSTFIGQHLVNHADELFAAVNLSLWYETPVTMQKLYLFLIRVTSKSIVPNIGGVYVSVMESFTSITSTAISFLMVIYSVQS